MAYGPVSTTVCCCSTSTTADVNTFEQCGAVEREVDRDRDDTHAEHADEHPRFAVTKRARCTEESSSDHCEEKCQAGERSHQQLAHA
jgi:hypothetical protein